MAVTSTNVYDIDSMVALTATFTNTSNVPTDPSSVSLLVLSPAGIETTLTYAAAQITRTGTGAYSYSLLVNESGFWTYKWQGAGVINQTSPDTKFLVRPSALIAG